MYCRALNNGIRVTRLVLACMMVSGLLTACGGGGGSTVSVSSIVPTSPTPGGAGGGTSLSQSPYLLFSSNYIAYPTQTNGAYIHSIQGGDIYTGFGGNYKYGNFSSDQAQMNYSGFYALQAQAAATAPTTAGDYEYVAFLSPGDGMFDISQSNALLIAMGNTVTTNSTGGNASVFTVDINNGSGTTAAVDDCSVDQTLEAVGPGKLSLTGVRHYAIPFSSFTCSAGSMAGLQSNGVTAVVVKIVGSKNPNVLPNEYDTIAVGSIGFTNWSASNSDITALAQ